MESTQTVVEVVVAERDEETEFAEFFVATWPRLFRTTYGVAGDRSSAEDALQSEGWRYVAGAIDAQLSFDGEHVLSWAAVLEPTRAGGTPITLAQGPKRPGYAFFTFDTDGSVLVALGPSDPGGDHPVYDCGLPRRRLRGARPAGSGSRRPDVHRQRHVTCTRARGHTGPVTQDPGDLDPIPGMDPEEPIPDDPAELDHPEELPPPPIEATPEDPGGDPGAEPAVT